MFDGPCPQVTYGGKDIVVGMGRVPPGINQLHAANTVYSGISLLWTP